MVGHYADLNFETLVRGACLGKPSAENAKD
jgi:hypothetical protein